jgi:hypothetical protein
VHSGRGLPVLHRRAGHGAGVRAEPLRLPAAALRAGIDTPDSVPFYWRLTCWCWVAGPWLLLLRCCLCAPGCSRLRASIRGMAPLPAEEHRRTPHAYDSCTRVAVVRPWLSVEHTRLIIVVVCMHACVCACVCLCVWVVGWVGAPGARRDICSARARGTTVPARKLLPWWGSCCPTAPACSWISQTQTLCVLGSIDFCHGVFVVIWLDVCVCVCVKNIFIYMKLAAGHQRGPPRGRWHE